MYHPTALYFTITSAINSTPPSFSATSPSSNGVGYKADNLRQGFTMLTPSFTAVDGSGEMDLHALKTGGEYASGEIVVQTLTALGAGDKGYEFVKNLPRGA